MNILSLCDSFKGTLSSLRANRIIEEEIKKAHPEWNILSLPFSDGGEGMLDVFSYLYPKAKHIRLSISDVFLKDRKEAEYLIQDNTAVIESAKANGIIGIESRKNPMITSTYGLGEIISDALDKGIKEFIIGLGGSCTDDGGAGMLSALGIKFYNGENEFIPSGGSLNQISRIDISSFDSRLESCHFTILSDVDNPLLGKDGATYTFARQKGASDITLPVLENNKKHYCQLIEEKTRKHCSDEKGSGAAGGLGFAFHTFFDSRFVSGAKEILSRYHFQELIKDKNLVITGEGHLDCSSLHGKVISVIAEECRKNNIKCVAVTGNYDTSLTEDFHNHGISVILETNRDKTRTFDQIRITAESDLRTCIKDHISLIQVLSE